MRNYNEPGLKGKPCQRNWNGMISFRIFLCAYSKPENEPIELIAF